MDESELEYDGHGGVIRGRRWSGDAPADHVVLVVHGYGEHVGRYPHVARRLVDDGAVVYGADHVGHGRSDGERVLVTEFESVVDDVHTLEQRARDENPGLPVAVVGHSMGGLIAARYAQRYGDGLACVVLSGPVLGSWGAMEGLLAADEIPDVPIDPSTLSRDPAVGEAYVADDLVWHGPFKRPTIVAMQRLLEAITASGPVDVPMLDLHGEDDRLVPMAESRAGWAAIRGERSSERSYPGARHEIFNETNQDDVLTDVVTFIRSHLPRREAI
ncbi:alpha-beta hydrolase superfamily lysophospholipase [Terracoccus luteus]|uniref:Alpha-beta hydrolase superfamily lysophospholipase n=1 Tax=Terracoccus luteus TaxID=53356 RepID=A0A495XXK7_9MICO|nr:alpha/beta hydrolase [Terracoccus luteus]RKT79330.1 alpha-beta hydrolase superfamily lysophospholipase [Terracoccus luteus]